MADLSSFAPILAGLVILVSVAGAMVWLQRHKPRLELPSPRPEEEAHDPFDRTTNVDLPSNWHEPWGDIVTAVENPGLNPEGYVRATPSNVSFVRRNRVDQESS